MSKLPRVLVVGGEAPGFSGAEAIAAALEAVGMKVTRAAESGAIKRLDGGGFDCAVLCPTSHVGENDVLSLEDFVRAGGGLVAAGAPGSTRGRSTLLDALLGCHVIEHSPPTTFKVGASDPNHPIAHRIAEFAIHDEMSVIDRGPDLQVFLGAWWRGRLQPVAGARTEGKGRVVCLANGRTPAAVAHPAWRQVLARSVRWAAGEDWSKKTLRTALIGYGAAFNTGRLHADALARARMPVVAVAEHDPKRIAAARAELGDGVRMYSDNARLLAECDAELIVVVTPHGTHAKIAEQCLAAGRNVVVEKPFTVTIGEATRVIDAARRAGRVATAFHNRRWDGDFLAIKKVVDSGRIGEVFAVECFFGGYAEPRADWWRSDREVSGGALFDWGSHFCDWILQLVRKPVDSVSGSFHKRVWHQVTNEDHSQAIIRFAGGATASIEQSWIAAIGKPRFRVLGTLGAIEQRTADPAEGIRVVEYGTGVRIESTVPCATGDWDGFYRNLADHLVLGEPLAVTPEQARDVVAVLQLAEDSAKLGGAPLGLPYGAASAAG